MGKQKKVKYTKEQLEVIKSMVEIAGNMADQFLHIMKNHDLDKVDGCELTISVTPEMLFATESITFGQDIGYDAGKIHLAKGRRLRNEKFHPFGENSTEYELLFADDRIRSRIQEILQAEKPLPPDGLWIGDPRNDYPVDCGWD